MTTRLPPLNALRAFEAAARHLSFKTAAEDLHVTPTAISHQIKTLEDYLGVKLFRRLNRSIELTEVAQACLPKIREGFDCLVEAIEQVRIHEGTGLLTVSVPPSFAAKWLMPRLHRFVGTHPDIDVRISASMKRIDVYKNKPVTTMELDYLRTDEADIMIRFGTGRYAGYRVDPMFEVSVVPMCSPKLLEGEHPLRQPSDLRYHTLLHDDTLAFEEAGVDWGMWLDTAGVDGVDERRGPHFSHAVLALDAAIDGMGVVLTIDILAATDLAARRLVTPFKLSLPLKFAYYIVTPETIAVRPNVSAFREWLLEEARKDTLAAEIQKGITSLS